MEFSLSFMPRFRHKNVNTEQKFGFFICILYFEMKLDRNFVDVTTEYPTIIVLDLPPHLFLMNDKCTGINYQSCAVFCS